MRSSSGFLHNLDIDRSGCRRTQALVLLCVLLALAAVGHGGLPAWLDQPALLLVLAGGLRELHAVSPASGRHVARIQVTPDGRFRVAFATAPERLAPVELARFWQLPGVALGLAFTGDKGARAGAILFRDRVAPDVWRRLVVRVRRSHPAPP